MPDRGRLKGAYGERIDCVCSIERHRPRIREARAQIAARIAAQFADLHAAASGCSSRRRPSIVPVLVGLEKQARHMLRRGVVCIRSDGLGGRSVRGLFWTLCRFVLALRGVASCAWIRRLGVRSISGGCGGVVRRS
jgi:hypothetical protein